MKNQKKKKHQKQQSQTTTPNTITKLTPEEKQKNKQDRRDYYKQYYEKRKGELLERAKISDKANYYKRAIRDLRSGRKNIEDFKDATIDKYKIKWDRKRNEYISLLDIDYQRQYFNYYQLIIIKIYFNDTCVEIDDFL